MSEQLQYACDEHGWCDYTPCPKCASRNPTLDDRLKTAFLADLEQHYINSLTPDRGYPTPIDNLRALVLELMAQDSKLTDCPQVKALPPCPNCKECVSECACMRNKCECGKSVGNITFTLCDECWEIKVSAPLRERQNVPNQRPGK